MTETGISGPRHGVLLVTADDVLRGEVMRLVAAAGSDLAVDPGPAVSLRAWNAAAVVLVGADAAASVARTAPPRRDRVHLVGRDFSATALADALGCSAEGVVRLPEDDAMLGRLLSDAGDGAGGPSVTVGVLGGAGGVGATTFAAALASCCAARGGTVLVDADPLGAGVDHVLGLGVESGVRWDDLLASSGRLAGRSVREALPIRHGVSLLAWPAGRAPVVGGSPVAEVLSALTRGFRVVVADIARYPDPVGDQMLARCDRALVVTTTTVPAVAATTRIVERLRGIETGLVVRRRAGGLTDEEVGRFLGRPVLAVMTDQRGLDEDVGLGVGPVRRRGPLVRSATTVAARILGEAGSLR